MNNTLTVLFSFLMIVLSYASMAQHIYPQKFEGCDTQQFGLESEHFTAKIKEQQLIDLVVEYLGEEQLEQIIGFLKIQIVAYTDKSSCVLSYENITNRTDTELGIPALKLTIDEHLRWEEVEENVSALIRFRFRKGKILIKRYGFDAHRGMHELKP